MLFNTSLVSSSKHIQAIYNNVNANISATVLGIWVAISLDVSSGLACFPAAAPR
jgi:hypothetical protein